MILRLAAIVLLAALGAGCSDRLDDIEEEYKSNRKRWDRHGLVSYQFQEQQICFCPQEITRPVTIDVENGSIVEVVDTKTGDPVSEESSQYYLTADGVFDRIADAIDDKADNLEVDYDPTYGYPTRVNIDWSKQAADDEWAVSLALVLPEDG